MLVKSHKNTRSCLRASWELLPPFQSISCRLHTFASCSPAGLSQNGQSKKSMKDWKNFGRSMEIGKNLAATKTAGQRPMTSPMDRYKALGWTVDDPDDFQQIKRMTKLILQVHIIDIFMVRHWYVYQFTMFWVLKDPSMRSSLQTVYLISKECTLP